MCFKIAIRRKAKIVRKVAGSNALLSSSDLSTSETTLAFV